MMTPQRAADEAAIRQQIDAIIEALHAKDLDALKRPYAPDVVSFDVEPPLRHAGLDAKMRNWERVFAAFADLAYEVRDLTLVVDHDVAIGHSFNRLRGTLRNGVATSGMWVRATLCFQRIGGEWLITHDHVSVPFDVVSGRGVVDLEP